jgi:hypothetical protein
MMIKDSSTRKQVLAELKKQGYKHPSGKPLEQIIIGPSDLHSMSYKSLKRPPYFPPNAKAITELPVDYPAEAEPEIASAAA